MYIFVYKIVYIFDIYKYIFVYKYIFEGDKILLTGSVYIYIYIYIYTPSQNYFVTLKYVFFILKNVILMKQFNHHNDFIHYTKCKSS